MIKPRVFKDEQGREYFNFYGGDSELTLTIEGQVKSFKVTPKIVIRKGDSKFGNQLLIQANIKELVEEYPAKSNWETIEFYFTLEQAKEILNSVINELEGVKVK